LFSLFLCAAACGSGDGSTDGSSASPGGSTSPTGGQGGGTTGASADASAPGSGSGGGHGTPSGDDDTDSPDASALAGDGSVPDAGPFDAGIPPQVASCAASKVSGAWENVTAGPLAADSATNFAYALDPRNAGTVYLGTITHGIWKTTDCGATWAGPINTGKTGKDASNPSVPVDAAILSGTGGNGMNWTMAIDPTNSALYTVVGYGANGLYKSLDGGVNWNQLLPASIRSATENGFVNHLSMDPTNPQHLIADFHVSACIGMAPPGASLASQDLKTGTVVSLTASTPTGAGTPYAGWGCVAETHDGGDTWSLTTAGYPDINGDGPGIQVVNDKTWFFGTQGGNLWRTTTGGVPGKDSNGNATPAWSKVNLYGSCGTASCLQPLNNALGFVYIASDGSFFSGGNFGVVHSVDGIDWTQISGEYAPGLYDWNGSIPIVDTGTTLYVAASPTTNQYFSAPLSKIQTYKSNAPTQLLTQMPVNAGMTQGNPEALAYDPVNKFMYSANAVGGFWRFKNP
jgi:hypothetical protein